MFLNEHIACGHSRCPWIFALPVGTQATGGTAERKKKPRHAGAFNISNRY